MLIKEKIKTLIPKTLKEGIRTIGVTVRRTATSARVLPDFIIIGAQRCGTTSLYNYLIKHPGILPAFRKEIHFFDVNFGKGIGWYRAHFPTQALLETKNAQVGEATPYYLFHPAVPERMFKLIHQAKLIILLRNPIDRAYSQYVFEVRGKREHLSFEEAIRKEQERLTGEEDKLLQNDEYCSFEHRYHSYLARGIYVNQLKRWMEMFPKEQFLILKSEDLYTNPKVTMERVFEFLKLPVLELQKYKQYNQVRHAEIALVTRKQLETYFEPYNQQLYNYLGINSLW